MLILPHLFPITIPGDGCYDYPHSIVEEPKTQEVVPKTTHSKAMIEN